MHRTEIFRDTQTTAKTEELETLFIDDNDKTWPASQPRRQVVRLTLTAPLTEWSVDR